MVRRKGNPFADAVRRLHHRAFVRRELPLREADHRELDAAILKIANGTETVQYAGSRGDELNAAIVVRFETGELAAAMQTWIDRSEIAARPGPLMGFTKEQDDERRRIAFEWGFRTGVIREAVQAYRQHMFAGNPEGPCYHWAAMKVMDAGPPFDDWNLIAKWFVQWAQENHGAWFWKRPEG